jgi:hypothetical protein
MERSDERLSTRDIASPTSADDARFERDEPAADHAVTGDTMATMADPASAAADRQPDRDMRDPDRDMRDPDRDTGDPLDDAGEPAAADPVATEPTAATTTGTTGTSGVDDAAPLLPDGEGFQSRWEEIQVRFVDEPRGAVEDADALVATVMQRLAEGFAQERERLEAQWGRGEDISTEDLRIALQRYRSFFQRLLST